jgi:prepilin-type N-terminal cleavage/methylation domain-containing protein
MNREDKGFTLIEMMVAAALFGLLCIMVGQFLSPMTHFFQRSRARQDANLQLRMCFGTIDRLMANGKASTLIVSTPPTTPTVQNSSATFQSVDGSFYTITWSPAPMNSVHLQKTPPGGTMTDTVLATQVTGLSFGLSTSDPGIVYITLRMTVPLDSSGSPDSFMTILLSNQALRMNPS